MRVPIPDDWLTPKSKKILQKIAKKENITQEEALEQAIKEYFDKKKKLKEQ
jgi:hypothetical protein